jgi:hypothetical protein
MAIDLSRIRVSSVINPLQKQNNKRKHPPIIIYIFIPYQGFSRLSKKIEFYAYLSRLSITLPSGETVGYVKN